MSSDPNAPTPAALTSLIGEVAGRHLSAAQAVEHLRLWDSNAPARVRRRGARACSSIWRPPPTGAPPWMDARDRSATAPTGSSSTRYAAPSTRYWSVPAQRAPSTTAGWCETRRSGELRQERGLAAEPLACIVSASLALDSESVPLLVDPAARVVIVTSSPTGVLPAAAEPAAPQDTPSRTSRSGRVRARGPRGAARSAGRARRAAHPVGGADRHVRGGPHLNGALLAAGLVDDLFLSLAPKIGGGGGPAGVVADRVRAGAVSAGRAGAARGARERRVSAAALPRRGRRGAVAGDTRLLPGLLL